MLVILLKNLIENMMLNVVVVVMTAWDMKTPKTWLCFHRIYISAENKKKNTFSNNCNTKYEVIKVTEVVQRRCYESSEEGEITSSCSVPGVLLREVRIIG